jgi:hypothetical protein
VVIVPTEAREESVVTPVYTTVPPVPNATEEASVPVKVRVLLAVSVLPLAIVSVPVVVVTVSPFTLVGVMAPRESVIAGVVVASATEPETPLAVVTETLVTVPAPPGTAWNVGKAPAPFEVST